VIPRPEAVLRAVRSCHARIVRDVRRHLAPLVAAGDYERAMAVHGEGVGDLTYAIDAVADRAVERLADELGRIVPVRVLCEGIGERAAGRGDPRLRVLVDPIDGTRNLMADLRSGWVLTGIAAENGRRLTTRDLELAVQTEIPTTDRASALELVARRGLGCVSRRISLRGGERSPARPWRAPEAIDLHSGYYTFLRYLPRERGAIAEIELEFFERARRAVGLDPRLVYDDQWLCGAGQLVLVSSGRMRMFADLRAHLAALAGTPTVAGHPYDLCTHLVALEAGSPVLGPDLEPLAVPLDLTTNVSFVAFANERARRALAPVLRETLRSAAAGAADRLRVRP
jgi:hypothetical protein